MKFVNVTSCDIIPENGVIVHKYANQYVQKRDICSKTGLTFKNDLNFSITI